MTPGLTFVDAVLWQMDMHENVDVWNVALHVVHHVATTPPTLWHTFFSDGASVEIRCERHEQFRRHGLTKLARSLPVDSEKYDVVLNVLDCCCGICDRDWTASRLRCDDLFVQAFADWSKCAVRIYTTLDGEEWTLVTPYRQPQTSCTFTFEVWRAGERFMSKRKQRGRGDEDELMRTR